MRKYWLVGRLVSTEMSEDCFRHLLQHYSNPLRYYHNLDHLRALFVHFDQYQDYLVRPDLVSAAIFYHDVIYDIQRQDNELASAAYAKKDLTILGFNEIDQGVVEEMILATIKHEPPQQASQDLRFFLDFDLAILGSEFSIYQAYAQKIRQEYAIFADELYIPGRIMVLEKLLDRPRLFQTEPFYDQYEEQARNNLHRELLELKTKSV